MAGAAFGQPASGGMVIDIWSDVICPFCYLGDAHLARALERFPHKDEVEIRYHSFELMPDLAPGSKSGLNDLLVNKRGMTYEQAQAANAQFAERGGAVGLEYNMDKAIATNTIDAHRLSHFAESKGLQHAMMIRLFEAYFRDGKFIGDHEVLADLAVDAGLDRAEALEVLASGAFQDEVDADLQLSRELGINGVPFFVLGGKYAVSGAQPVDSILQALEATWTELGASQKNA
jgi:predicted DsbA family dithiol-disulfide isomerase